MFKNEDVENESWPNTLSAFGVYGGKKIYAPQWLIRDPRWRLADGEMHDLSDQQWLVTFTLFRRCRLSKKKPRETSSFMSVTEISELSGLHKSKVSKTLKELEEIGLLKRIDKRTWDLGPAIEKARVNGTYRYRKIPRLVADLVAVKTPAQKRLMGIKHLRLWSLIYHYWILARTELPYVEVVAMKMALGCEKDHTVCKTYRDAEKAGFIRRYAAKPMKSAHFDPIPVLDVLRARVNPDFSKEPIEIVFDKLFEAAPDAWLTPDEFETSCSGVTEGQRKKLRAMLTENFGLSKRFVSVSCQERVFVWSGVKLRSEEVCQEEESVQDRDDQPSVEGQREHAPGPTSVEPQTQVIFLRDLDDPDFGVPRLEPLVAAR